MEVDERYLVQAGVPAIVEDMLQALLHDKPNDPVDYFRSLLYGSPGAALHKARKQPDYGWPSELELYDNTPVQKAIRQPVLGSVRGGARVVDWQLIAQRIPISKSPQDKARRNSLFKAFDPNGNGYLSLAEVDKGLRDVLRLEDIYQSKPAIMRAFQAAKRANPNSKSRLGDDYVTRSEFRLLLVYLRRYFELFVMFDVIDTGHDRRIDLQEFKSASAQLSSWGIKINYPEQQFKSIDKNGGGQVLFQEFAEWALTLNLELEVDDDEDLNSSDNATAIPKLRPSSASSNNMVVGLSSVRGGAREIDWNAICAKIPCEKTPAHEAKRDELFRLFDPNGNGYLSLAEVDKGIRDVLGIQDLYQSKPAIMRAFQAAKRANPNSKAKLGDDYVTRSEFRILLVYLRRYFELFIMFDLIDKDSDRRIDILEFKSASKRLQDWGIDISHLSEEFSTIDVNGGGVILFDEFASWAIGQNLRLFVEEPNPFAESATTTKHKAIGKGRVQHPTGPALSSVRGGAREIDWERISEKLPTSTSPQDKAKRDAMFRGFDPNGNGYLSLAEVDKGIRDILGIEDIYQSKPAIMRAFQAAKKANPNSKAKLGADYVTRSEFRLLLVYLKKYFELFVMFDLLDGNSDRRVDLLEFKAAIARMKSWGLDIFYPEQQFKAVDKNGGGFILFDEFCDWALGKLLENESENHDEEEDRGSQFVPMAPTANTANKSVNFNTTTESNYGHKGVYTGPALFSAKGGARQIDWAKIAAQIPTDNSKAHTSRRNEMFNLFDPNGNGYLSLAEVDKGIRDVLGLQDLYQCKPAIMRAFQAAKRSNPNSKAKLGDDYVTKSEFRTLLVYLRRYFELFVMFDLIDGNTDRRVDFLEFKSALNRLRTWGIVINDPQNEFHKIDKNGGGMLLFDEFAEWAISKSLELKDD